MHQLYVSYTNVNTCFVFLYIGPFYLCFSNFGTNTFRGWQVWPPGRFTKIAGIKQGVSVKKALFNAMKEDQVKTMGPGSSVIWPVVEVEMVIITCLERTSVSDGSNKKAEGTWVHLEHTGYEKSVIGSCNSLLCFFFFLSFWLLSLPPGPGRLEWWEDSPRSTHCQRPRAGLAQQPCNDTISSDL